MELLIASEADTHHIDQDGRTALSHACLAGHIDIVKVFLDMGESKHMLIVNLVLSQAVIVFVMLTLCAAT